GDEPRRPRRELSQWSGLPNQPLTTNRWPTMEREQAIKLMQDLLRRLVERKGSDLFITSGFPPAIKIDGEIRPQSERVLTPEQAAVLVRSIMNDKQTREFDATKECNFAIAPTGI